MRYKMIIFDIDGTITKHVSSWRYIHEKLGLWDVLAKKYQEEFLAGKITYRRFCELDAAHWKGIRETRMRRIFDKVQYSKNAVKCIKKLKNKGFKLVAISTGLQFITDKVRRDLNFDYCLSNHLTVKDGRLTGGVKINISHGAKGKTVKKLLKKFKIAPKEIIAVGDSEGDIPMIEMAGYSIAFNSSSKDLSKIADHNCLSDDFREIYCKILEVERNKRNKIYGSRRHA
ncbi:MAG: HAD family phosphatase [Candidatus Omnitrophica bacterium]|nr:HAD family phosphatase [Candidatus Omnitrophota bacterium]